MSTLYSNTFTAHVLVRNTLKINDFTGIIISLNAIWGDINLFDENRTGL